MGEEGPRGSTASFPRDSGVFADRRHHGDALPCAEGPRLHMGGFQRCCALGRFRMISRIFREWVLVECAAPSDRPRCCTVDWPRPGRSPLPWGWSTPIIRFIWSRGPLGGRPAGARSDCRPRSLVCVGRRLTPVRSRSSSAHPMRPMCLSWVRFIPCGTRLRGEKWRSGRSVPPRTRPCCHQNRAITRKLPDASGAPTRTILPERQNRGPAGSERPSTPRTPLMRFPPGPPRGRESTQRGAGARRWACHRRARRGGGADLGPDGP